MPPVHPMIVHFAVALTLTAAVALPVSRFIPQPRFAAMLAMLGTLNLCIGSGFAVFAIASGIAAVWDLKVDAAARAAVSTHVKWAFFTTLALILLSVWRGAGVPVDSKPSTLFLVVMVGCAAALTFTAYLGGENVYRYGIGVIRGLP